MNSFLTKNAMKFNGLFAQKSATNSIFVAVLLTACSGSAFANRPMMDDPDAHTGASESATSSAQGSDESRPEALPEPEAPSAVELMMQQQNQQTRQSGDTLQLPAKEIQPGETLKIQLLDYPRRGMSMDKVQQQYGQPMATSESVGTPPITHWTYSDRVVYFEYSTVLHVVAR